MKIGVALSGCDIGGIGAYSVLHELEQQGLSIGMVSACGLPSVSALLYACGYDQTASGEWMERFLCNAQEIDLDMAVAELSAELPAHRLKKPLPFVVSSVNVSDGRIGAFTNDFTLSSGRLKTFPLADPYDALSGTISPLEGLASYKYGDFQLCDFSVWYGCPVYPLKMAGLERVVSIAFLPHCPHTPYEVMVKQRITASAHLADIHIPIVFDGDAGKTRQYIEIAREQVVGSMEQICIKTLF